MIKASVAGAASPLAGELLRILINHPEVDVENLYAPGYAGHWIGVRHKGMIGDTDLRFSDQLNLENTDVLFICGDINLDIPDSSIPERTKVIVMDDISESDLPLSLRNKEFVGGLSEVYRKPLVRGATAGKVLNPVVAVSFIALYPLALHLMLNNSIRLNCNAPYWILRKRDKKDLIHDLDERLSAIQLSFNGIEDANFTIGKDSRAVGVNIEMPCGVSIEEIRKLFDGVYDDHNFAFLVDGTPDRSEVLGTQKCLIHLYKPTPDTLHIEAVADGVYRGGVGDAIHTMNLLFGLFEKIGLTFKAAMAFKESYDGC